MERSLAFGSSIPGLHGASPKGFRGGPVVSSYDSLLVCKSRRLAPGK